jgi:hypothetical protein
MSSGLSPEGTAAYLKDCAIGILVGAVILAVIAGAVAVL